MRRALVAVLITVFVLASAAIPDARAAQPGQEGKLPPNTPISNIEGILPMPEAVASGPEAPFRGTGKLAPAAARVIPEGDLNLPTVEELQGLPAPESVIGADGRVRVTATTTYPYRAIAYLVVTWAGHGSGTCTGWFYGTRIVGTAGHCVYDKSHNWGWASSIKVYPGRNGSSAPYSYTTSHRLFSVTGWTSSGSPNYDYGAIQTDAAKGSTVGWFGYFWQSSNTFPGNFTVAGYPGDKTAGTLWKMAGPFSHVTTYRLWYKMDTYGGQSGSPVYQYPSWDPSGPYSAGFHTYGVPLSPYTTENSATRIRQAVFNNMKSWKYHAYP